MVILAWPLFFKWAAISTTVCVGGVLFAKRKGVTKQDVAEETFDFVSYVLIDKNPRPRWLVQKKMRECEWCDEEIEYTCWRCM